MALRIGLTGGIGSGKSTVAALLAERGAALVDADRIAHRLTGAGGPAIAALREAFGPAAIAADGALDRAWMRARAFEDPAVRQRLEAILHPRIRDAMQAEAAAREAHAPYVVLDIPLLGAGARAQYRLDRVLVVDCPPALQIARAAARSGIPPAQLRRIIEQQTSRADRLGMADDIIVNAADRATLAPRVRRLDLAYRALAGRAPAAL